jgi:predicted ATP-grasp superfamily ATP-dependent carboligase
VRTLIVGLSTRAIAESATRSGHPIITLDYFGDRDQRSWVENYALQRDFGLPFSASALLQASKGLDYGTLVYVSNLENHPRIVGQLGRGRVLLGNPPAVLRRVRDWRKLRAFCSTTPQGWGCTAPLLCPTTLLPGEEPKAQSDRRWLRKPIRSGGGHDIGFWAGERLSKAHLLQEYIQGRAASAAFIADGERCVVIGLTEQLIGRPELGAQGFAWCGNILPFPADSGQWSGLLSRVERMASALTHDFGLRGVNGMDLLIAQSEGGEMLPFLVEVNPRYTASMELVERAYGLGVFALHVAATDGQLPAFSLAKLPASPYFAKGIVYARTAVTMPETEGWMQTGRRDIPYPGERIEAGHPVCTVLTQGESRESCWSQLVAGAEAVRQEIGDAQERPL